MADAYTFFEHRHNFAVWAAARAAQRGLNGGTVAKLKMAIESTELPSILKSGGILPDNRDEFDRRHSSWCDEIVMCLLRLEVSTFTYGRAAKLLGVYLKSMVVLSMDGESQCAVAIHPPIDRVLLQALASSKDIAPDLRVYLKALNWTQFSKDAYRELIVRLRNAGLDRPSFWSLERYWDPARE